MTTVTSDSQTTFKPLSRVQAKLGESPVWSATHQAIWWVDILGQKLLATRLDGTTDVWGTPELPGFVHVVKDDIYVGMCSGIFRFDLKNATFERLATQADPLKRFNDACHYDERYIFAGTMDLKNATDDGCLYRFDLVTHELIPVMSGFHTINGLARQPEKDCLFLSDSHPLVQKVWTCDVDRDGNLHNRQEFADFTHRKGRPDGACFDLDGRYWIAGVGGGEIYSFTPDGSNCDTYQVPLASPTKPLILSEDGRYEFALTSIADKQDGGRLALWYPDI